MNLVKENKIGTIKNPLSVIAIFAGIAEISGTMVLPHIHEANQTLFIWFLMLFPFTLVILFFITLNWNHKVLYAPSDFKDEEHFVNLQKATTSEILMKMEDELSEQDDEQESNQTGKEKLTEKINLKQASEIISSTEMKLSSGSISTKEERQLHSSILRNIHRQRMIEIRLLEDILINKLQSELGQKIERDMKLNESHRMMFDGVIKSGENITLIEVKRMNRNTMNRSSLIRLMDTFRGVYSSLNDSEKKHFSLIFAIATDDDIEEMKNYLSEILSPLEFNYFIKVYPVDELANEQLLKAS